MLLRRSGFTLLEICLALLIGLLVILLAVPSIAGLLAEQRLKTSFERFQRLVAAARAQSISAQRAYVLVWDRQNVSLRAVEADLSGSAENAAPRLVFEKDEVFTIERPAALSEKPAADWTFWSNGTCEPAVVSYHGPAGAWQVRYNPLTAQAAFLQSNTR